MERKKTLSRPRLTFLLRVPYIYIGEKREEGLLQVSIIADTTRRNGIYMEIRAVERKLPFCLFTGISHRLEQKLDIIRQDKIPELSSGPFEVHAEPTIRGNWLEAWLLKSRRTRPGEALRAVAIYLLHVLELQPECVLLWRMDIARIEVEAGEAVSFEEIALRIIHDQSHLDALKKRLEELKSS